jgi:two-component system, chemotaxis family, protein-glutamate methylesterase/glutaminase
MVKVLVVDHSPLVRQVLCGALARDLDLDVVGSASDPFEARDLIEECQPDVLILEIDLPRMDGITFLRQLRCLRPMPAIVLTSVIQGGALACAALTAGAVDVVHKPDSIVALKGLAVQLAQLIKAAATVDVTAKRSQKRSLTKPLIPGALSDPIIAIGSSIGGDPALEYVLTRMHPDSPGIVVAHQMPEGFVREFVDRLNQSSRIEIKIAEEGDPIASGLALVSPGNSHIVVRRSDTHLFVSLRSGPLIGRQRPSIDILFLSVAAASGSSGIGVILAGMGRDGTQGLLEIQRAGGTTLAQGEAMALGLPKAAIECGVIDRIVPIEQIPEELLIASSSANDKAAPRQLMV